MPTYGFQTKDKKGRINTNVTDRITRLRWSTVLSPTDDSSITIDDLNLHEYSLIITSLSGRFDADTNFYTPHVIDITGNTISWEPGISFTTTTGLFLFYYT